MDKRVIGGLAAVLAAGVGFWAMSPGDGGDEVAERTPRAAPAEEATPAAPVASADPEQEAAGRALTPMPTPPGGYVAPMGGAGDARDPSTVASDLRALGVQLEGARVALPDDEEGVAAVLDRAVDELSAVEREVAAGNLAVAEAKQRVIQIRLDAAIGFDGVAAPEDAKALKEALGFDMTEGDELGWGVPLTEANFGQIFGEEAGGAQ